MRENDWGRRLSQLRDLQLEVDELSQCIANLELSNTGKVSAPGPNIRDAKCIEDTHAMMDIRRQHCMDEIGRLFAFIDDIPDSRLRRIFTFRYIEGLTWQQVAFRLGEFDEQYPRKMHSRYLQKMRKKA